MAGEMDRREMAYAMQSAVKKALFPMSGDGECVG